MGMAGGGVRVRDAQVSCKSVTVVVGLWCWEVVWEGCGLRGGGGEGGGGGVEGVDVWSQG